MPQGNDERQYRVNIVGFPGDEFIDIPEEKASSNKNLPSNKPGGSSSQASQQAINDMFNQIIGSLGSSLGIDMSDLFGDMGTPRGGFEGSNEEQEYPDLFSCDNMFDHDIMWTIPCMIDGSLYTDFLSHISGGKEHDIPMSCFGGMEITGDELFEFPGWFKSATVMYHNDRAILLYCTPEDNENKFGAFVVCYRNDKGKLALLIPRCGNTYMEDGYLYDPDEHPTLFNKNGMFKFVDMQKILTGAYLTLVPSASPLVSPNAFGEFRETMPTNIKDGNVIPIGMLKSNGSSRSTMLIKDFDLDENQEEYPLYIRINGTFGVNDLVAISGHLHGFDFASSLLFDSSELKPYNGDSLLIDVSINGLAENISRWIKEDEELD